MTKAMAIKLSEFAPKIIHENQAGFVKERSIFDQTRLARAMLDYAEANEEDGMIVALDQEKSIRQNQPRLSMGGHEKVPHTGQLHTNHEVTIRE